MLRCIFILILFYLTCCKSSASMSGGAVQKPGKPAVTPSQPFIPVKITDVPLPPQTQLPPQPASETAKVVIPPPAPIIAKATPANPTPPANAATPISIEGHEVQSSCAECLSRAKALANAEGFTASQANSRNYGPTDQSTGLCDVHFYSPAGSNHGEIFLYCPCNCGWPR